MEGEMNALWAELAAIWGLVRLQFENLMLPSRLWQLALILAVAVASQVVTMLAQPRMREWMRGRDWPIWRLRLLLVVDRRLRLIFFFAGMWMVTWAMRAVTPFPSRSYILALVATLATAWLIVVFGARLVRNPVLRRVVRWALWVYVTLWVFGLVEEVSGALDQVAFTLGEVRLSLLILVQAVVLV